MVNARSLWLPDGHRLVYVLGRALLHLAPTMVAVPGYGRDDSVLQGSIELHAAVVLVVLLVDSAGFHLKSGE